MIGVYAYHMYLVHNDYCGVFLHMRTVRYNMSCNVGVLKVVQLHCSRQQCFVAEWSGHSVTVTVRVRAREWDFFPFLSVLCDKRTLSWHGVITLQ